MGVTVPTLDPQPTSYLLHPQSGTQQIQVKPHTQCPVAFTHPCGAYSHKEGVNAHLLWTVNSVTQHGKKWQPWAHCTHTWALRYKVTEKREVDAGQQSRQSSFHSLLMTRVQPQNTCRGGRRPISRSCPLTSVCALWQKPYIVHTQQQQ